MLLTKFDEFFREVWCVTILESDDDPDHVTLRLRLQAALRSLSDLVPYEKKKRFLSAQ